MIRFFARAVPRRRSRLLTVGPVALLLCVAFGGGPSAQAAGFASPEECQAYEGQAHLNCLYAYIERQQDRIGKVEEEVKSQKESLGQLRGQLERAAPVPPTPPSPTVVVPPPVYVYPPVYAYPAYPPAGFSLFIGPLGPRYYGYGYGPGLFRPRFGYCGPWRCW